MTTILDLSFDGVGNGVTATGGAGGNTAEGGYYFDAMESTLTGTTTYPQHGAAGLLSGTGSGYARKDFTGSTTVAYRAGFRIVSTSTGDVILFDPAVSTTRYVHVKITASPVYLRVTDNSAANVYTSAATLSTGTDYWFEVRIDSGTTTSNGKVWIAYYLKDSTTPIEQVEITNADCGAGTSFTRAYMLHYGSGHQLALDDLKLTDTYAAIGPFGTPVSITGVAATASAQMVAPAVSGSVSASVTAVAATAFAAAVAPEVEGRAIVSGGGPMTASAQMIAPTVETNQAASITAVTASASAAAVAPAVAFGSTVTGVVATSNSTAVAPAVGTGVTVTVMAASASATMPVLDVSLGVAANVAAVAATASADAVAPSVDAVRSVDVSAVPASASSGAVAPSVSVVRVASATATTATSSAQMPAPAIVGGATITAVSAASSAQAVAPSVLAVKSLTVAATAAVADALLVAPAVLAGSTVQAVAATASALARVPMILGGVPSATPSARRFSFPAQIRVSFGRRSIV